MPKGGFNPPPRPKRKPKPEPLPTLPQHQLPAPYAALITLGDSHDPPTYAAVAAQIQARDPKTGVAQLVQMALDESYYDYVGENYEFEDDPRSFTRVHVVRTLSQLGAAAAPAIEPLLPLINEEDDWLREEMPLFYAAVGEAAIEPLAGVLMDAEADLYARAGAGDALAEMAEQHPELRPQILSLLEQALLSAGEDEALAGFVITNLLDIGARESLPLIEQAFQEDRVDLSVVQLAEVQEHFGLPVTAPWVPIRWGPEDDEDDEFNADIETEEMGLAPEDADDEPVQQPYVSAPKVGRNEPCPCGSGKKYKKCCGA